MFCLSFPWTRFWLPGKYASQVPVSAYAQEAAGATHWASSATYIGEDVPNISAIDEGNVA
jgi:hypothetical protein